MKDKVKTKVGFDGVVREIEVNTPPGEPPPYGFGARLKQIGGRHPRVDGMEKVTGRARFTHDVRLPGMLHGRLLHSETAAATIRALDTAEAERMEGVRSIEVFKGPGRPLLYHGDVIAAVAADTAGIAEDAIQAIRVELEAGTPVTTVEAAMEEDAPRVFADRPNVRSRPAVRRGDADRAIEEADVRLEHTYRTQVQTHSCPEPHGVVARFEKDGSLTLWASTQGTFGLRAQAAEAAGLPQSKVRVFADHVGGGFGSKFSLGPWGVAAVRLARKTGRAVKLMLDREAEHHSGGNRPDSIQEMRGGVDRDGRIRGLAVKTWGTGGVAGGAGCANPMIYAFGPTRKEEAHVYTHAGPAMAFRAPGHPQGAFALESFLDECAETIGMDPLDFRMKNCSDPVLLAEWATGALKIGWAEKRKRRDEGVLRRGVGMASARWGQAGGPNHEVDLVVHRDGAVEIRNGAQDIGTGTKTVLAVIVAEELGLRPKDLLVRMGDTRLPHGPGSGGSTTAPSLGPAARMAAIELKRALGPRVAAALGAEPAALVWSGGSVSGGRGSMSFRKACRLIDGAVLRVTGRRARNYQGFRREVGGCQFAEVEVDTETGVVRVVKVVAVQDAGRAVNRLAFESQIAGAVVQGIGYALLEERVLDRRQGTQLNADLLSYKTPGAADVPEIETIAFDVANGVNNCGMMGLGEPPAIPTAAAIANAVAHALGVRIRRLPITPARVLEALETK